MKKERQQAIVELIGSKAIETQEELTSCLNERGFNTTQATVSRDIRELELSKIPGENGRPKYGILNGQQKKNLNKFKTILKESILAVEPAGNILVIKTASGMAMASAAALDSLSVAGIVGSIAGDDTIMCVVKDEAAGIQVKEEIQVLTEGK